MSLESLHNLLLSTARTAATRADSAEIAAAKAFDEARIATEGKHSRKKRARLRDESIIAQSGFIDAELDAGRAVEVLRQFEEDNGIRHAKIELPELVDEDDLEGSAGSPGSHVEKRRKA